MTNMDKDKEQEVEQPHNVLPPFPYFSDFEKKTLGTLV